MYICIYIICVYVLLLRTRILISVGRWGVWQGAPRAEEMVQKRLEGLSTDLRAVSKKSVDAFLPVAKQMEEEMGTKVPTTPLQRCATTTFTEMCSGSEAGSYFSAPTLTLVGVLNPKPEILGAETRNAKIGPRNMKGDGLDASP